MFRITLPYHLRTLANVTGELSLDIPAPATLRALLDALESRYPMLRGTIRDHVTLQRRPFLRFFACEKDLSNEQMDTPLSDAVASGASAKTATGNWQKVTTVRVNLLVRAAKAETGFTNTATYALGNASKTVGDGFRRQLIASTINLRNY